MKNTNKTNVVSARLNEKHLITFNELSKEHGSNTKAIEFLTILYSQIKNEQYVVIPEELLFLVKASADCDMEQYIRKVIADGIAIQNLKKQKKGV